MPPSTKPVTCFGPDFPFAYDDWLSHPAGLGSVPVAQHGSRVAIIGAGAAGIVAGYELMRMGLHPVLFEAGQLGGRLRSQAFEGTSDAIAELGGMRFPSSGTGFNHYVNLLGVQSRPFPNPLTGAAGSTVIDLEGKSYYAERLQDLPAVFQQVAQAYGRALEQGAHLAELKAAIRARDATLIKQLWNPLVREWDERSFYDFLMSSKAFKDLTFRHREIFGQVGFGTGGWDSDFSNSMLEILRVNATECDEDQHFMVGGVEQVPQGLWRHAADRISHWGPGTTLASLNRGSTRPAARRIFRNDAGTLSVTDQWGHTEAFDALLVTCQSHLLTTGIDTDEQLLSQHVWMAMDRTRYMQSSKTFVMVDRPFWKDKDPRSGRDVMSMTLTDRITRGTYLFDLGPGKPGVMCLTYSWMTDALKMLPLPIERRVELALSTLEKIYPHVDIRAHIIGDPITVSWEADANFLGAFKGALPGHYRYNHRMFSHFMQSEFTAGQRGIFLAGDDIGWTPGWVEGAVQTALNAVWGVMTHLGGHCDAANPGPGDRWHELAPIALGD